LVETNGVRLVTDPYSPAIGYEPLDVSADIVTLSHENPKWHSHLESVGGEYQVVRGLEITDAPIEAAGIRFGAVKVHENLPHDGPNAMIWFESEGLRVLHMGDCGHLPLPEQVAACGQVDILLALASGFPTLPLDELMEFVRVLRPKYVVPMHFGVPHLAMKALPLSSLVEVWPAKSVRLPPSARESSLTVIAGEPRPDFPQLCPLWPLRQRAAVGESI